MRALGLQQFDLRVAWYTLRLFGSVAGVVVICWCWVSWYDSAGCFCLCLIPSFDGLLVHVGACLHAVLGLAVG